MNRPVLELRQIRQNYGAEFALAIDRLDIEPQRTFALLGPNGAGKSTLLRILAGLQATAAGQIRCGDHTWGGHPLPPGMAQRITLVFQRPLLLNRSVRANLKYGLRLRGKAAAAQRDNVARVLSRLRLEKLAGRPAHTLSGGQIQLAALARALVIEPEVLLLDEPTANLDPAPVALVEEVIAEDHQRRGTTLVWATHNLFQARRVAQTVGLLLEGQLVEVAATEKFFADPADARTAGFVNGRMIY